MSNTIKTRLQLKHDTLENWEKSELSLALGEVAFAQLQDGSFQMRVGVGDKKWSELSASPIKWSADQIEGLTDAMSQLSTTHYEVYSLNELSNSYNNGDTAVVKTKLGTDALSNDVYSHTAYIYDSTASTWKAMDGNYSADNIIFDSDLTYTTAIGVLTAPSSGKATLTAKGRSLEEVLKSILSKAVSATQVKPTAAYATPGNYDSNVEVGTWASGANGNKLLQFKYNADGYWSNYNPSSFKALNTVKKSDITITRTASQSENFNGVYHLSAINATYSFEGDDLLPVGSYVQIDAIPTSDLSVQYQDTEKNLYTYSITGKYLAGTATPKNNLGDDDPSNKIPGGTFANAKSATVKIVAGKRKRFWYIGNDITSTLDNAFFRSTDKDVKSDLVTSGSPTKTISLAIPAGTQRVVFALEGADKTLKTVIDVDGMGLDVAGNFSSTNVDINGANGYTAKTYTVFEVINTAGLKQTTYNITVN